MNFWALVGTFRLNPFFTTDTSQSAPYARGINVEIDMYICIKAELKSDCRYLVSIQADPNLLYPPVRPLSSGLW